MASRVSAVAVAAVFVLSVVVYPGGGGVAASALQVPKPMQFTLRGGSNSVLGFYTTAALGFDLRSGTMLSLGLTTSGALGLEPFVSLSHTAPLGTGWNLRAVASYGDTGGDYRVERLPEVTLWRSGSFAGTPVSYTLEAGAGYFMVRPGSLSGSRGTVAGQVGAWYMPLSPTTWAGVGAGGRQYAYSDGASHSGYWGWAQVGVRPMPTVSATLSYLYHDISGSSPLVFDAMTRENYLEGGISVTLGPTATVGYRHRHSFLTQAISARIFSLTLPMEGGQLFSLTWDDVPQKLTFSYTKPLGGLGPR